jgi:hypothetical protein
MGTGQPKAQSPSNIPFSYKAAEDTVVDAAVRVRLAGEIQMMNNAYNGLFPLSRHQVMLDLNITLRQMKKMTERIGQIARRFASYNSKPLSSLTSDQS